MAVSKKGKRKVEIDDRVFMWFVSEEPDDLPSNCSLKDIRAVTILSEDKLTVFRNVLETFSMIERDNSSLKVLNRSTL